MAQRIERLTEVLEVGGTKIAVLHFKFFKVRISFSKFLSLGADLCVVPKEKSAPALAYF